MEAPLPHVARGRKRTRRLPGLTVPERLELDRQLYQNASSGTAHSETSLQLFEKRTIASTVRGKLKSLREKHTGDGSSSATSDSSLSVSSSEDSSPSARGSLVEALIFSLGDGHSGTSENRLVLPPQVGSTPVLLRGQSTSLFPQQGKEEPLESKKLTAHTQKQAVELIAEKGARQLLKMPGQLLSGAKRELKDTLQHSIAALLPKLPKCKYGGWLVWERDHALLEPGETFRATLRISSGEYVFELMKELKAIVATLARKVVHVILLLEEFVEGEESGPRVWKQEFDVRSTDPAHVRHLRIPFGEGKRELPFRLHVTAWGEWKIATMPISLHIRRELSRSYMADPMPVIGNSLVYCVTWNVDETGPPQTIPPEHIQELLEQGRDAHIIVIGLQEVGFSATRIVLNATGAKATLWERALLLALQQAGDAFSPVCSYGMSGIWMIVFVRKYLYSLVRSVKVHRCMVGLSAKGNSKGAVGITLKICQTRLCFLNAHLSAHQEFVMDRNDDFRKICNSFVAASGRSLYDYDVTIWMGDLNYRIDLSNEEVRPMITSHNLSELLRNDQLRKAIACYKAFDSFAEAPISFPPTFKFDPGTNAYDTSSKNRVPAWCDRILWHGDESIAPLAYRSYGFRNSDHKPVSQLLRFPLCDRKTASVDSEDFRALFQVE